MQILTARVCMGRVRIDQCVRRQEVLGRWRRCIGAKGHQYLFNVSQIEAAGMPIREIQTLHEL